MKIDISKKALSAALARVVVLADPKSTLPVARCVLLECQAGAVKLTSTDLLSRISELVTCSVARSGSVALPARELNALVSAMPEGNLSLSVKDDSAELKSGARKFKIRGMPAEDFPKRSNSDSKTSELRLNGKNLSALLSRAQHSVSDAKDRAELCGIKLVLAGGKLEALSTNGLSCAIAVCDGPSGELDVFIPARVLGAIVAMGESSEDVSVVQHQSTVVVSNPTMDLEYSKVEAPFPPIKQVIPPSGVASIRVDSESLASAVKSVAAAMGTGDFGAIRLDAAEGKVRLSFSGKSAESSDELDSEVTGAIRVDFSPRLMADTLKAAGGISVIECSDDLAPIVVRSEGFTGVVMPMRP